MQIRTSNVMPHRIATDRLALRGAAIALALLFALCTTSRAGDADALKPASIVSPFLDDDAIAIAHFDTTQTDLDHVAKVLDSVSIISQRDNIKFTLAKTLAGTWINQFQQAGGRDIYLVLSLADDLTHGPLGIVPLYDGAKADAIAKLLKMSRLEATLVRDGVLLFGTQLQIDRVRQAKKAERAIPADAVEAVADADIQLFVIPSEDQRRVLGEFLAGPAIETAIRMRISHRTPKEMQALPADSPGPSLRDSVQWAAIGVRTPLRTRARVVIESKNESAAQSLAAWLAHMHAAVRSELSLQQERQKRVMPEANALVDAVARVVRPKVEGNRLTIALDESDEGAKASVATLAAAVSRLIDMTRIRGRGIQLANLALGMFKYHDQFGSFPAPAILDKDNKPLLSWRVEILPFIDQAELYKQFHLDEPWDSPHNMQLISKMPDIFVGHGDRFKSSGLTTYVVPVGEQTIFTPTEGKRIRDITDGAANTILLLDVSEHRPVIWTQPDDLVVDGADLKEKLFGADRKEFVCVKVAEGERVIVPDTVSEEGLRAAFTRASKDHSFLSDK